jgi:hypothetical protein
MDFWDLLDDWKLLSIIAAGLFIGSIWLSLQDSRSPFTKRLYRLCAAFALLAVVGLLWFTWWPPGRVRDAEAVAKLKRIALVTLAADTELLTGKGGEDAKTTDSPAEAHALAYVQLEKLTTAFKSSPIVLIPSNTVSANDSYRGLSYPFTSSRKSGLFASKTMISATDDLRILPVQHAQNFAGLGAALDVDALLIVQTRYELDWDWRESIPLVTLFTNPYWYGNVRTRAWLVDRTGNVIWRYRESLRSSKPERAEAFNYLVVSGSKITAEQSIKLLMDAIDESSARLTSLLTQDVASSKAN